jgi:hypothetical protein
MTIWQPLAEEFDRWGDAGMTARLWLRDDDAIEPSPQLDRLADVTERFRIPVVVAIIPAHSGEALARRLQDAQNISPAVHGWAHVNHAPAGHKKQELGLHRGRDAAVAELAEGLGRMIRLHGARLLRMLVPPWNRIDPVLVRDLPAIGYEALSVFGDQDFDVPGLAVVNTHVDLIDFRGTGCVHDRDLLVRRIAEELSRSRRADKQAVGILSHHLADPTALDFLEDLFSATASHPACRWAHAGDLM